MYSYEEMIRVREAAIEKYAKFVEGLSRADAGRVAVLLDNQQQHKSLHEADITTTGLPTSVFPTTYAFPLIAQVFPNLVANRLFNVQPMNQPVGSVFYKSFLKQADSTSFAHSGSYAKSTEGGTVVRGTMKFSSATVTAQKFILQASWSTELSEDLRAMKNLDVETEMMAALRDEIIGELDFLCLNDVAAGATAGTVVAPANTYSYQSHLEHWGELRGALIDADVLVTKKRQRRTNYIVGNSASIAKVRKVPGFVAGMAAPGSGQELGSFSVGRLDQWEVWESANYPNDDELLLGIKGEGYIFAPYVALELMPAIYVGSTDEVNRNVRTRAGRILTMGDAFSKVNTSALT